MTIEQARQMIEEVEEIRDDYNDSMHLWAMKWQSVLAREEVLRDKWANEEEKRIPKRGIEEILDFTDRKRKLG